MNITEKQEILVEKNNFIIPSFITNDNNNDKLKVMTGGNIYYKKYMKYKNKYLKLKNQFGGGHHPYCCPKNNKCEPKKFKIPKLNKDYAIVTLLMMGDSYLSGVLTLGYSIRKVAPKLSKQVDLVCMVTNDISEQAKQDILTIYDKIIPIEYIEISAEEVRHKDIPTRKIYGKTFTKLTCVKLTQYKKILLMDADMIVIKPELFHLFSLDAPAGVFMGCGKPYTDEDLIRYDKLYCNYIKHGKKIDKKYLDEKCSRYNKIIGHDSKAVFNGVESTILVLEPNLKDFENMVELTKKIAPTKTLNGDATIYSMYYENRWHHIDLRFLGRWTNPSINPEIITVDLYGNQGKPWNLDKVKSILSYPDVKFWISKYKEYYDDFFKEHCNHPELKKLMDFYKDL
jgi:alpha-N-acetylglucosamine transferase